MLELSLVIPAFQEAAGIVSCVERCVAYAQTLGLTFEILVIDDGSTDSTSAVLRRECAGLLESDVLRLITSPRRRGKGHAVRSGLHAARGSFIVTMDADLSAGLEAIPPALAHLRDGCQLIFGSRLHPQAIIHTPQPRVRRLAGAIYRGCAYAVLGLSIRDLQCGFKAMTKAAADVVCRRATLNGYAFDAELAVLARAQRWRIAEIPVHWTHRPSSRVRLLTDSPRMLGELLAVRWRQLRHRYD